MKIVLILIALPILAVLLIYLLAPRILFDFVIKSQRGKGGLVQKSVKVGDITWPYLEGGNLAGKPLVLVHGFGGDKDNWAFYAPHIKQDYRLIFPDLPGFGENDRSVAPDHSVKAQTERLGRFLDALGIDKCHLGGNSMGGGIALRFAFEHPERLLSLTLFNNLGVTGTVESDLQNMVETGSNANPLVPRTLADVNALLGFVAHKPRWIPAQFKRLILADIAPHQALLDKIFGQILEEAQNQPFNDRLGEIKVPVQIIWGRHDQLIHVSCANVQHEGIAGSELVIFEDIGHVPMIEKPAEVAQRHLAFLAKH